MPNALAPRIRLTISLNFNRFYNILNPRQQEKRHRMLRFLIQNIQAVLFIENFAFRNKLGIASRINEAV